MSDLVLGIRLKADGSGLVGQVRLSKKEIDKLGNSAKTTGRKARGLSNEFDHLQKRGRLLKVAMIALATGGLAKLSGSFLKAASTSEQFQVRLKVLLGSQGEANRMFREMSEFASRVPFEFERIMGSAAQLSGVVRGGVDEVGKLIPIIADIAAGAGLSIDETTTQIVRMYSAGAAAADMFRERGVTAALGFQAGLTYSAQETMDKIIGAWEDGTARFKGATDELAKTWTGITSMMSDKWFQFRNQVMDAAPFDYLKAAFSLMNEDYDNNADEMKKIAEGLGEQVVETARSIILGTASVLDAVSPAAQAAGKIIDVLMEGWNGLPAWAQEMGVLGAIMFGKKGFAAMAGMAAMQKGVEEFADNMIYGVMEQFGLTKGLKKEDFNKQMDKIRAESPGKESFSLIGALGDVSGTNYRADAESIIADLDKRVAAARAARKIALAETDGGGGGGGGAASTLNKAAQNRIDGMRSEVLALGQLADAWQVYGGDMELITDLIEAETAARDAGLKAGSDEYQQYVELALAIRAYGSGISDAEAANELHAETVKAIRGEFESLPKTYAQAAAAAAKWRAEAMAGLDETKQGYAEFAAMVEDIYQNKMTEAYEDALYASREWSDGAIRSLRDWADEATNAAWHFEDAITGALDAGRNAFVKFAETGKFEWDDLLSFMRKTAAEMLYDELVGGFLKQLLNGLTPLATGTNGMLVGGAHAGAIIGQTPYTFTRTVDPAIFSGARRMHSGGLVGGEVPIIAKKGEVVGWPEQMAKAFGGGNNVQINITAPPGTNTEEINTRRSQGSGGIDLVEIIIPAVKAAADRGMLDGVFGDNFGLGRTPGPGS